MASKEAKQTFDKIADQYTIDFQEFIDLQHDKVKQFKKDFKRDWNANHEKVEKQMEDKVKQLNALAEELLELAQPEEKNIWKHEYEMKVVIKKIQK
jgi:gas vesicle protein